MSNKRNGAGADSPPTDETYKGQKVIEIVLDSGEIVHIKPLSIYLLRAIRDKSREMYPDVDKSLYEIEVNPDRAALPGMKHPVEDNPDYRRAVAEVESKREEWGLYYIMGVACTWPAGKEALIDKYHKQIEALSEVLDIEGDDWEVTLKYCLIGSEADRRNIQQAALGSLYLTEGEVRNAMRIFRPVVSRKRPVDDSGQAEPSGDKAGQI